MSTTAVDGVLVVGGGYAGVHAARSVIRAGRRAFIVDPTGRHDFVTRLAAVAGGTASVDDASTALTDFSDDVIIGSMSSIADGEVTLDDGRTFTAEAVIVTAGAVPLAAPIEGLRFASPLRTADDALTLRTEIDAASSVVIVGGGATGVQLAGAVAAKHPDVHVTLIEGSDTLLAGMSSGIGADAGRILRDRGVDIHLGAVVEEIGPNSVTVAGSPIDGLPSGPPVSPPVPPTSGCRSMSTRDASTSTSTCVCGGGTARSRPATSHRTATQPVPASRCPRRSRCRRATSRGATRCGSCAATPSTELAWHTVDGCSTSADSAAWPSSVR